MIGIERDCPWCEEIEGLRCRDLSTAELDEFRIQCRNCGAMGPEADSPEEAIKSWNERERITSIIKCDCRHKWQDGKYGPGNRIHNETKPKSGTGQAWTCTVCGKRREGQ